MKLLIFEWLVGGGCWIDQVPIDLTCPIQSQGRLMLNALVADAVTAGHQISVPADSRFPMKALEICAGKSTSFFPIRAASELNPTLRELAARCDGIVLIAPESDGCLETVCQWLEPFKKKFLSPDLAFVRLTSNKQATAECLGDRGVSVPAGFRLSQWEQFFLSDSISTSSPFSTESSLPYKFPLVLKPVDGAGSDQVLLIENFQQLQRSIERIQTDGSLGKYRVENFVAGTPVSVSVLCGRQKNQLLPPTQQIFDAHPFGNYVSAQFPLPADLAERASHLATVAIESLPSTRGYVGIDMVLAEDGANGDCVVDVNPRLTMSYLKLREICGFNLLERMTKGF